MATQMRERKVKNGKLCSSIFQGPKILVLLNFIQLCIQRPRSSRLKKQGCGREKVQHFGHQSLGDLQLRMVVICTYLYSKEKG